LEPLAAAKREKMKEEMIGKKKWATFLVPFICPFVSTFLNTISFLLVEACVIRIILHQVCIEYWKMVLSISIRLKLKLSYFSSPSQHTPTPFTGRRGKLKKNVRAQ
jgi:hypothetical protein